MDCDVCSFSTGHRIDLQMQQMHKQQRFSCEVRDPGMMDVTNML